MKPSIEDFRKWASQLRPFLWGFTALYFVAILWFFLSVAEDMAELVTPGRKGWWQAGAVLWSVTATVWVAFAIRCGGRLIGAVKEEENDREH